MEGKSMTPPFLDAREIARNRAEASLDEAATQTLLDLAQRISADPDLGVWCWARVIGCWICMFPAKAH